jgi:hypothetical protein
MLELGTLNYPYKTMKSVSSELLNFHSNTLNHFTLFVKDVYVEDQTFYLINISSVTITTHPDLVDVNKKAIVIPTAISQIGISGRNKFHLLQTTDISIQQILVNSDISDTIIASIPEVMTTFIPVMSGFKLFNIDFYREEIDEDLKFNLIIPIYMQELAVELDELDINVTGTIMQTRDPMSLRATNLVIDLYS